MAAIGALVVNFNTASLAARCVDSLLAASSVARILVLDNASRPEERALLAQSLPRQQPRLAVRWETRNLGFAAGCNAGIATLLRDASLDGVLLANSDAIVQHTAIDAMAARLDAGASLVAARVMGEPDRERVDSLGIAMYASLLASNRLSTDDPLLGPTGGLALYSRRLLDDLAAAHGYVFDEDFFCYAEDTDLALRALLLGHEPDYLDAVAAYHHGQASSGGGFNDFVLYHGIRNSVWMLVKDLPASVFWRRVHLVLALHAGIVLRHAMRGKAGVVWRLYRDALRALPRMWAKRRRIQRTRRVPPAKIAARLAGSFYEPDYLARAWRELWRRGGAV